MGDSGSNDDTSSTAEDFNSLEVTDPGPPSGGDDNNDQGTTFGVSLGPGQGSVSATGSTAQDAAIGFTDGQGGAGVNFEAFGGITNNQGNPVGKSPQSPSEFASVLNATQGGDSTPSVSVPSIQAAAATPTFAQSASIFDPDLGTMTGRRDTAPKGLETGVMAPEQKGTLSYTPFGDETRIQSFLPAEVSVNKIAPQTQQQLGLAALAQTLNQARDKGVGMGDARGIDFGVTAPVASIVGDDFGPALDMVDARTQAANQPSIVGDDFGPALDMVDSRTTATGAEDPFDPDVGRPFDAKRMADIEAIYGKFDPKTGSYPTTAPGIFGLVEDKTKDALATSVALGRNLNPIEAIFGYTAPNMAKDKETIEEYNARTGASIPDSQLIRNDSGVVIGIKDAMGNLVTGNDPSARANDQGSDTEQKKAKPKAPTDPCPEGYQLIDGKCTPIAEAATGTGFQVFPANRNPSYRTGPFSPSTVATGAGGIRGLNPITFNPFNK